MISSDNASDYLLPCIAILAFCFVFASRKRSARFPPGPSGLPIVGYAPFIGNPTKTYMRLGKKYGDVFAMNIANQHWVVLNSYDAIYEALVKKGNAFAGRPHVHMYHHLTKGKGIVIPEGPSWKVQKKFGMQSLKRFGFGKGDMESLVISEVGFLLDELSNRSKEAFDPSCLLSNISSNIICQMTLGQRYGYDDAKFNLMLRKLNQSEKHDGKLFNVLLIASFTRFLPVLWGVYNRFVDARNRIIDHVKVAIEEHKNTFDPHYMRDFIDEFLQEMKANEGEDSSFDEEQLVYYVVDLFVGGSDTTSTTLRWVILALLTFPDMEEKIFREICSVVGENRFVSLKDKDDLPFTCSVIHEVLRHRCVVPQLVPHKTLQDVDFRGYLIPAGTFIIPHIWSAHFDPKNFDQPQKFRPDRFINEDGDFVPSPFVAPFSFGPRRCLGEKLATAELFLIFTNIVQRFKVVPDPNSSLPDFYDGVFGGFHAPHEFKCRFKPRE